jgi:DNA-directed RNA polymerase specialized sigma24 family protein
VPYDPDTAIGGPQHRFPTTRQSLIDAAAARGPAALDDLAAVYWKPAYKHIRIQWRRSNEEAKDLVQGFFAAILEQDILAKFDPEKGRLRTYLRACLDRFVMKQDESAGRMKRGAGFTRFDFDAAELEIASSDPSPENIFFREWQREMFALAVTDLRDACRDSDKAIPFRVFEQFDLAGGERPAYAELAAEHAIPVTQVTNYLAWARRELRRLLLERLHTVTSGDRESRAELRTLFGAP